MYEVTVNGEWLGEMEYSEMLENLSKLGMNDEITIKYLYPAAY